MISLREEAADMSTKQSSVSHNISICAMWCVVASPLSLQLIYHSNSDWVEICVQSNFALADIRYCGPPIIRGIPVPYVRSTEELQS